MIKIQKITEVQPHPNADRLEVAIIGGWTIVVQKETFKKDDLVVFIPPDSILPERLHEHLGITKYCGELPKDNDGVRPTSRRIKAARIRGTASYGTIMSLNNYIDYISCKRNFPIDVSTTQQILQQLCIENYDVTTQLDITKWNSPVKTTQGDMERDNHFFHKYTKIVNWRDYGEKLVEGEEVVISSKIHGTSNRLGLIEGKLMAGSHNTRRKSGLYWAPFEWYPQIEDWLNNSYESQPIIIFGEIFGSGIQDMRYGMENGKKDFRAFDISVNGKYLDWKEFENICNFYKIPIVPVLYRGPYSREIVEKYTTGPAAVCNPPDIKEKFKGREGCVIKPVKERQDEHIGRIILKSISVDYLER